MFNPATAADDILCRFKGSHTGERITDAFKAVCNECVIKNKLDYIISDNAANMKRAFMVCFPQEGDDAGPSEHLDDDTIWEQLGEDEHLDVELVLIHNCRRQRLQCFTHTMQLVISDGLNPLTTRIKISQNVDILPKVYLVHLKVKRCQTLRVVNSTFTGK